MIDCERAFLDSVFLIYHLENHQQFSRITTSVLADIDSAGGEFCTSVVSIMEFCVEPYRSSDTQLLDDLNSFLLEYQIIPSNINIETAVQASKLRARYPFLRGMDALQVSSALTDHCDAFVTNDHKLKPITEIRIVLSGDLVTDEP